MSKSILDTSITTEEFELYLYEALRYITSTKDIQALFAVSMEEVLNRVEVKKNLSNSPAFIKFYHSLQEAFYQMIKMSSQIVGENDEIVAVSTPQEVIQGVALDLMVTVFMIGIKVGRSIETKDIEKLDTKYEEAKERIEEFAKEMKEELEEVEKEATTFPQRPKNHVH